MYIYLTILALFVFFYSVSSGALEKTPVNGALVFTAFGVVMGPLGLSLLDFDVDAEVLRTLAELTLAMVLFTDASNANLAKLKKSIHIPVRLLLVGLPLTILLGYGVGILVFDELTVFEIAILATMLAPTDAALGKAVVTNEAVPSEVRESLNVESGLNDGICVPILFLFLALASASGTGDASPQSIAIHLISEEIGIGVLVGVTMTVVGAYVLKHCSERGWISESLEQVPVPALALVCFAMAQWLGGSGFIACFVGGMLFGAIAGEHKHMLLSRAEATGSTLSILTWIIFGAVIISSTIESFSWSVIGYSLLSLTVIRMVPVFLVLTGMKLRADEKLFAGWFGPRGLASIVFGVIVINEHLPGGDVIALTTVCTILLSVIAHGLSANPLVNLLARRLKGGH